MNLSVSHYSDIKEIPEEVDNYLYQKPAINFEAIGILEGLRENATAFKGILECVVIYKENKIQVITCRIKPFNLLISHSKSKDSIVSLVEHYLKSNISIPGIYGPLEEVIQFTEYWEEFSKEDFQTSDEFYQYSLNKVKLTSQLIGDISIAKEKHKEILVKWTKDSIRDTIPDTTDEFVESCTNSFLKLLSNNKVFVLEIENELVSMAAISSQTTKMKAIIDVYTPPKHRGKGYATELCLFLSEYIVNDCSATPILWVKATNLVAIHIYEKIGFEKVAKMALCLK